MGGALLPWALALPSSAQLGAALGGAALGLAAFAVFWLLRRRR